MDSIADEIETSDSESVGQHPKVVKMKDRLKAVGLDVLTELSFKIGGSGQ